MDPRGKFTVLVANKALGTAHFCGTFGDQDAAIDWARGQADRSRNFVEFTIHTGIPRNPGVPTSNPFTGAK